MSRDSWARARVFCEKALANPHIIDKPRLEEARWFFGGSPIAKTKFDEAQRQFISKSVLDEFNNWKGKDKPNKTIPLTRRKFRIPGSHRFVEKAVGTLPSEIRPKSSSKPVTSFDTTIDIMSKLKPLCEQTSVEFVKDCLDKLNSLQIGPEPPIQIVTSA